MTRRLLVLGLIGCLSVGVAAQTDPGAYFANQVSNYWRAVNDPDVNDRVRRIWFDLVDYSHIRVPVVPAQTFQAGLSQVGVVLLDVSIAGDPDENVTAFWMGHEYGHQVLGHPFLGATSWGRWLTMRAGTANEDAADRWSTRFMKAEGYDIEPAIEFLCTVPSAAGDTHSPGPVRARNVARAWGDGVDGSCGGSDLDPRPVPASACVTSVVACPMVQAIPIGSPCSCYTPYGPIGGVAR